MPQLTGEPAKKQLDEAAARLQEIGLKSGDSTLNEILSGLASTYKSPEATDKAAAEKLRASTISSFQVLSRACGNT
ncbi:hypothetical protein [Sinosporangium siamense]|uniref:Uncharacterized protein n=1 Tax=Sinosporangium siamense TaxID=1367973 RepID=A0A919RJR3_9ACTN|nr:hypothetical protein [Sinosporangium siamense]GII94100.1 hypothetical protein Ssi02_43310 [Sinosporangium siamense]